MNALLIVTLLSATLLELDGETGVFAAGYSYEGGALGEGFVAFGLNGRLAGDLLHLEGGVAGFGPLELQGARSGGAFSVRGGLHFRRVEFSVGVLSRLDGTQAAFSVLPSARLTVRPSALAITLGVLDRDLGPLARLGVEYGWVSAAWAFPLGGEVGVRIPLGGRVSAGVRVWGFQLFNAFNAGAVAGLVYAQ